MRDALSCWRLAPLHGQKRALWSSGWICESSSSVSQLKRESLLGYQQMPSASSYSGLLQEEDGPLSDAGEESLRRHWLSTSHLSDGPDRGMQLATFAGAPHVDATTTSIALLDLGRERHDAQQDPPTC